MSASDQSDTATACETCAKVFDRPDVSDLDGQLEEIELNYSELQASAKSGCDWCSVQCQSAERAYEQMATDEFRIEEMRTSMKCYWYWENGNESAMGPDQSSSIYLGRCEVTHADPQFRHQMYTAVYCKPCPESSPVVRYHDFPSSTSSESCKSLVMRWWKECRECHAACQTRTESWLPTRLLDTDGPLKLVSTLELAKHPPPPYIALSHRWGSSPENIFKLTSFNETQLKSQVPLEELSQSFRDAIEFTQRIGVRYLWIDSLCIMQDSADDWQAEAATMSQVYKQCTLNIAVNPAKPPGPGMFQVRSPDIRRCLSFYQQVISRKEGSKRYLLTLKRNLKTDRSDRTLHRRAWVIQERFLSPRTVHFSDQLFWECRSTQANETFPLGIPRVDQQNNMKRASVISSEQELYYLWHRILIWYVATGLTFPSDRFVALGAIAKDFEHRLQTKYCAGLWMAKLPHSLLWALETPGNHVSTRQAEYRCPTWSWASLDFPEGTSLAFDITAVSLLSTSTSLVQVIGVHIESPHGNHHTEIQGAEIILKGRTKLVTLDVLRKLCHNILSIGLLQGGYWLDLGPDAANDGNTYILPVSVVPRILGIVVCCLLLKGVKNDPDRFERIGVLNLQEGGPCPYQLEWVWELVDAKDPLDKFPDRLTLV